MTVKKILIASALAIFSSAVTAQNFPAKPVRILVGFGAGGATDIVARTLAQSLTADWKQNVLVENRAGASGMIAAEIAKYAAPDGYTLLLYGSPLWLSPFLREKLPYDPVRDFAMISPLTFYPFVVSVTPASPFKSIEELIAYAKANPGKLNFAISGTGGAPHLAGIAFAQRTGINWAYIPYKGGSQAVADVASGQANVIMNGMLATYPTMKSGRIRALAISSAQRVGSAPEVPTIAETLPGFETGSYQGLLAPAGTPRDVVGKLNAEVAKILATPEMREKLAVLGTEVRTAQPEALGTFIAAEKTRWAQVIKESGIKFD